MMQLTKTYLRQLIKEAINEQVETTTVELTEPGASTAAVSAAWPDGVLYQGAKVYDIMYGGSAVGAAETMIKRSFHVEDMQEVYLGYSPEVDVFVMGFDVWEDDAMAGAMVEMTSDGRAMDAEIGSDVGKGMYGPGGMYENQLKQWYPDLIDIRLD
jgi:hypothetical protein